jgi:hypothetical protein
VEDPKELNLQMEEMVKMEVLKIKNKMPNPATLIVKTYCVMTLLKKTYSKLILK